MRQFNLKSVIPAQAGTQPKKTRRTPNAQLHPQAQHPDPQPAQRRAFTWRSRPGIYKALGDDGNPSFETIRSILSAMGLRLTVEPAEAA